MADSITSRLTRKVGPLPTWGWAALIVIAYLLYRHFKTGGGSPTANPSDTASNPVPGFDAAGNMAGAYTPGTGTVNNYYYGDQNAGQATGGGTSSGQGTRYSGSGFAPGGQAGGGQPTRGTFGSGGSGYGGNK